MILIRTEPLCHSLAWRWGGNGTNKRVCTGGGGVPWRTNTPLSALCLSSFSTSSYTTSSLLKATFPEGPFHLSVFNYGKWIPWKRETEGAIREREWVKGWLVIVCFLFSKSNSQFCQQTCLIAFIFSPEDGFPFLLCSISLYKCILNLRNLKWHVVKRWSN